MIWLNKTKLLIGREILGEKFKQKKQFKVIRDTDLGFWVARIPCKRSS